MTIMILQLFWTIGIMSMGVRETDSYYSQCFNGYCYSTDKTWRLNLNDAKAACQRNGSYLATITSQDQQNNIVTFINNSIGAGELSYSDQFLLNAKRIGDTWTWVNRRTLQPALKENLTYDDAHWLTHASIQRTWNTRLYADNSFANKSFICGSPSGRSTCNGGLYFNNTCYIINNTQLTWFEARYSCLKNGGDLAMLDFANSTQDLTVFNDSFLNSNIQYWVGLKRNSWYWEYPGEVEFTYTNWGRERPLYYSDSNCSFLDYNSFCKWSQCSCDETHPFICVKTIDTKSTTMSTTHRLLPTSTSSPSTSTSLTSTSSPSTSSPSTSSTTTSTSSPSTSSSSTSTSSPSISSSSTSTSELSPLSSEASLSSNSTEPTPISSPSESTSSASTPTLSVDSTSASNDSANATVAGLHNSINTLHLAIAIGVGVGVPLVLGLVVLVTIVMAQRKKLREVQDQHPEPTEYDPSFYEDPVTNVRNLTYVNIPPGKPTESNFYETVSSEFSSLQNKYGRAGDQRRENYTNFEEVFGEDQSPAPNFIRPSPRDTLYVEEGF